jgi:hypothetical protein
MVYGGTNWGHLAFPRMYILGYLMMTSGAVTTYDYWAPIKEDRSLNEPKYSELKVSCHSPFVSPSLNHPPAYRAFPRVGRRFRQDMDCGI